MTSNNKALRRVAAGIGALALGLTGATAFATAASAEVGPDQPDAPTSGTLTINKYSGAPVGEGETPNPDNLLDGVEFTVTQVGLLDGDTCTPIDLTDAAQWDGLEGLFDSAPALPADPFCLVDPGTDQVTADGTTTFDLGVGVYFVEETDSGENPIVSKVPNFYVSIPTSLGAEGDGWTYDVVADPKNQLQDAPTKVINPDSEQSDFGYVIGDTVEWTITVPVPTLNNEETFTEAVVTDTLDARVTFVADSSEVTLGGTALVEGTDFTVSYDGTTGEVVWTFTPALFDTNMGEDLVISFETTVDEVGDGIIPNTYYDSTFNNTTTPGTDVPYTYWGQLSVMKVDDSQPQALPLEGAEFQVFPSAADGTCSADVPTGASLATGTSDANGVVQWDDVDPTDPLGLWVANSNSPLTAPTSTYCLYETVVPAGHAAVPFAPAVEIVPGEANALSVTVENAKTDGPELPLTGAAGTLALTIAGLLLVGGGVGAIMLSRHRRNQQA